MTLNGRSKWVLLRWVARRTGTLTALDVRIQANGAACRRAGRNGYGRGNGGSWYVTTHPVRPGGAPDMSRTLASDDLRPCRRGSGADVRQGVVRLPLDLAVTEGEEYATVIRNADAAPGRNYTSTNFLYANAGIEGANGRDERSPATTDSYYGLDPRELVGYSADGGRHWSLPGGQYGRARGRDFLPTYVQEFAQALPAGQPFYYARPPSRSPQTMLFSNVSRPWTIVALGAYTPMRFPGTLTLKVDGAVRDRVPVAGPGMIRSGIPPVTVLPGQTVEVSSDGLAIGDVVADTAWGRLMGMDRPTADWRLEGGRDFSSAAPIYPLPACGGSCAPGYGGTEIIGM
ncbi:MAG: hypothetical protein JOZ25_04235 [Actinobacteria bacterium]|nr:hypothetical protein [Actinomycetota bacterium]